MNFLIVSSFKNPGKGFDGYLESIPYLDYPSYQVVLIDDASTDGTTEKAAMAAQEYGWHFIQNEKPQGAMFNQYSAIHQYAQDDDVIVWVDGDDRLIDENVLMFLAEIYENEDVWLTFGSYIPDPPDSGCKAPKEFPKNVIANNSYRLAYHGNHLRTMRYSLFKKIPKEMMKMNGEWIKTACDYAIMVSGLELAGGRFAFIKKPLYVYSSDLSNADWRVNLDNIRVTYRYLEGLRPLKPLKEIIKLRYWTNEFVQIPWR